MDCGSYRDRVTIQTRETTAGALGRTVTADWSDSATRWCARVPVSVANQALLAQRGHQDVTDKLVFRGELVIDLANTRFVIRTQHFRPVAPPDVDTQKRTSSILVSLEVQRA